LNKILFICIIKNGFNELRIAKLAK
jgi:hypothetical protein